MNHDGNSLSRQGSDLDVGCGERVTGDGGGILLVRRRRVRYYGSPI